ncbi:MAG TPA: hypothetical protein VMW24_24985 [Sedimentisphaerales bacterium]|nr:hypothetical protein [Sedimentisphaerales bacterium]
MKNPEDHVWAFIQEMARWDSEMRLWRWRLPEVTHMMMADVIANVTGANLSIVLERAQEAANEHL